MIFDFSVSSLRLLQTDVSKFIDVYENGLSFNYKSESEILGDNLHKLIYYKIKNFDISKIENNLDKNTKNLFDNLKNSDFLNHNFVYVEKNFLIKLPYKNFNVFLNGRYDAIFYENDKYTIIDWKTKNLPSNIDTDIQSVVYLYTLSKLLNTDKIEIMYVSVSDLTSIVVSFKDVKYYEKIIFNILDKYYSR